MTRRHTSPLQTTCDASCRQAPRALEDCARDRDTSISTSPQTKTKQKKRLASDWITSIVPRPAPFIRLSWIFALARGQLAIKIIWAERNNRTSFVSVPVSVAGSESPQKSQFLNPSNDVSSCTGYYERVLRVRTFDSGVSGLPSGIFSLSVSVPEGNFFSPHLHLHPHLPPSSPFVFLSALPHPLPPPQRPGHSRLRRLSFLFLPFSFTSLRTSFFRFPNLFCYFFFFSLIHCFFFFLMPTTHSGH